MGQIKSFLYSGAAYARPMNWKKRVMGRRIRIIKELRCGHCQSCGASSFGGKQMDLKWKGRHITTKPPTPPTSLVYFLFVNQLMVEAEIERVLLCCAVFCPALPPSDDNNCGYRRLSEISRKEEGKR